MKKNVLVMCTGNSCRSQIAHAYLNLFHSDKINVYSAGIETHGLNPNAVATLLRAGIDISHHTSNNIYEYESIIFDTIITVCDHANEICPFFPSHANKIHRNFSDPSKKIGTEHEIQLAFDQTRDEIKSFCEELKF